MRKLCLTVIGLYISFLSAFSQSADHTDSVYETKPLRIDEVNLVSSYYTQEGNHSAVTGGVGNEHVVDMSNGLDVKFVGWDARNNKHSLGLELGYDHHTAASSAYVSKTGASSTKGTRVYPSINWTVENNKGNSFGLGMYLSSEYNYKSFGLDVHTSKKISSNTEINGKFIAFFDQVKMIYPSELIPTNTNTNTSGGGTSTYTTASGNTVSYGGGEGEGGSEKHGYRIPSSGRNTYSASITLSQIINTKLQLSLMLDLTSQNGYLGLPFHRVYFTDGKEQVENLPYVRNKLPIGLRLNYFMTDNVILRTYYRFYIDNWGLTSHTGELEVPVKITPFFSVSPFFRYYTQTAVKYFAGYGLHNTNDKYFTSNYSLSALTSQFLGIGVHLAPPKGIFDQHISALELRAGHYTQSTDLSSNVISLALTFK